MDKSVDSLSIEQLAEQLSTATGLPQPTVSPELSYGRHRGPAGVSTRIAAVAVTLYQRPDGQWTLPLTLRPSSLQHHAGQVCLPGGRVELDEDVYDAAMREFEEELGFRPRVITRCGELSTQYVYASNNLVHPVVAIIQSPQQPWDPDPVEVEKVIPVPLRVLLDDAHRTQLVKQRSVQSDDQEVGQLTFRTMAFQYQDHTIWGATAMILDELAQILRTL